MKINWGLVAILGIVVTAIVILVLGTGSTDYDWGVQYEN